MRKTSLIKFPAVHLWRIILGFFLILILLNSLTVSAQLQDFSSIARYQKQSLSLSSFYGNGDSIVKKKVNPDKKSISAMYKSLFIPGWGQLSNRQYWKIPVIYAGLAGCIYSLDFANKHYKDFRQAYIYRTDKDSLTIDKYDPALNNGEPKYNDQQLKLARDYYRRNIEISVMITAGIYIINVLDAYVSSELLKFDVTDDLSLQFAPPVMVSYHEKLFYSSGIILHF